MRKVQQSGNVRYATQSDVPQLLQLMEQLADFEGYREDFHVTEHTLLTQGFGQEADFSALVAEKRPVHKPPRLDGMLIYYVIPFTYDLHPTLFIKELYVKESARGQGIGRDLMTAAAVEATRLGCGRIKWDVLKDNFRAKAFYGSLGGEPDSRWEGFKLEGQALSALARTDLSKENLMV